MVCNFAHPSLLDSSQSRGSAAAVPSSGAQGPRSKYAVSADGHTVRQWSGRSWRDRGLPLTIDALSRTRYHQQQHCATPSSKDRRCPGANTTESEMVAISWTGGQRQLLNGPVPTILEQQLTACFAHGSFDSHSPAASSQTTPLSDTHTRSLLLPAYQRLDAVDRTSLIGAPSWRTPRCWPPPPPHSQKTRVTPAEMQLHGA